MMHPFLQFYIDHFNINVNTFRSKFPTEYAELMSATAHAQLALPAIKQRMYLVINGYTSSTPVCLSCNDPTKWNTTTKAYGTFCSAKCSANSQTTKDKRQQTMVSLYGVTNPAHSDVIRERKKKTCQLKYRGDTPLHSATVREKIIRTNNERYGTNTPLENDQIRQHTNQTKLDKYGTTNMRSVPAIDGAIRKTNNARYGGDSPFSSEAIQTKSRQTIDKLYGSINYQTSTVQESTSLFNNTEWLIEQHHTNKLPLYKLAELANVDPQTIANWCKSLGVTIHKYSQSQPERDITAFIESLKCEVLTRTKIHGVECDLYIPTHNLAIEYCGLYWHSDTHSRITNSYHRDKLEHFNQNGIRLVTIFEDEWLQTPSLVLTKLQHILGRSTDRVVYARNTTIQKCDNAERRIFMDTHHIQGNGPGSVTYKLSDKQNRTVAMMTFICNDVSSGKWILNRYCTESRVLGGFSKLVSHFCKHHKWYEIKSFADLRWSCGDVYSATGFNLDGVVPPDYRYVVGKKRIHKFNFRHQQMKNKLPNYDDSKSERDNMKQHNIHRIYDCGLLRYIKINNHN